VKRALKIDPEETDFLIELGEIYVAMQDFEHAEEMYEKICRNEPWVVEAWLDLAMCLFENGKLDEALKALHDSLDLFPGDHRIYYRLAAYFFMMGYSVKAFENLNAALEINWEDHFLLFMHAPFLEGSESVAETIDLYRQ
jgi:tetratricopeptide (TPR) repeat protein